MFNYACLPDGRKNRKKIAEELPLGVFNFYKSFIQAGTFNVSSIKVAEAAKIIENTQRDINIALFNELSIIFKKLITDRRFF